MKKRMLFNGSKTSLGTQTKNQLKTPSMMNRTIEKALKNNFNQNFLEKDSCQPQLSWMPPFGFQKWITNFDR